MPDRRSIAKTLLLIIQELIHQLPLIALGGVMFIMAFFWVKIDSSQTYGFGSAIGHGVFWIHNGILSLFTEREVWAPINTGIWYNLGFIAGSVVFPFLVRTTIQIMVLYLKR